MTTAAILFRFIVGLTFVIAGIAKFSELRAFEQAVWRYDILPARVVRPTARLIPAFEVLFGGALVVGLFMRVSASGLGISVVVFAIAIAVNLLRGRVIDCGCAVAGTPERIGWSSVARNLVLAAMAAITAYAVPGGLAVDDAFVRSGSSVDARSAAVAIAASIVLIVVADVAQLFVRTNRAAKRWTPIAPSGVDAQVSE